MSILQTSRGSDDRPWKGASVTDGSKRSWRRKNVRLDPEPGEAAWRTDTVSDVVKNSVTKSAR